MRIALLVALIALFGSVVADELTHSVEAGLAASGYETGPVDGVETIETIIAISKYQAENNLPITGEITPELAMAIQSGSAGSASGSPALPTDSGSVTHEQLKVAQQACLEERIAEAREKREKKKGFGSLMKAVSNTASRFGKSEIARDVAETSRDIYDVDATSKDWKRAAADLGLKKKDIRACENPFEES